MIRRWLDEALLRRAEAKREARMRPLCRACGHAAVNHVEERQGDGMVRHLVWQPQGVCAAWFPPQPPPAW